YQHLRYLVDRADTLAGPVLILAALTLLQPQTTPADRRLWLFSAAGDSLNGQPTTEVINAVNRLLPLPGGNQKTRIIRHADSLLFIQPGRSGLISVLQVPQQNMATLVSHHLDDDMFISAAIALLFIAAMALMLEIL